MGHTGYVPVAKARLDSSTLHQFCPPNEKVTLVKFEIEMVDATGTAQLVFPASFVNFLIKHGKADQPQKKGRLRYFPTATIRERILDCDVNISPRIRS